MGVSLSLLSSKQDVGEKLMQLCLEIINVMTLRTRMKMMKQQVHGNIKAKRSPKNV